LSSEIELKGSEIEPIISNKGKGEAWVGAGRCTLGTQWRGREAAG